MYFHFTCTFILHVLSYYVYMGYVERRLDSIIINSLIWKVLLHYGEQRVCKIHIDNSTAPSIVARAVLSQFQALITLTRTLTLILTLIPGTFKSEATETTLRVQYIRHNTRGATCTIRTIHSRRSRETG